MPQSERLEKTSPSWRHGHQKLNWTWAKRALLVAFLTGVTWLMVQQARHIAWTEVMASVRAYSWATVLAFSTIPRTDLSEIRIVFAVDTASAPFTYLLASCVDYACEKFYVTPKAH